MVVVVDEDSENFWKWACMCMFVHMIISAKLSIFPNGIYHFVTPMLTRNHTLRAPVTTPSPLPPPRQPPSKPPPPSLSPPLLMMTTTIITS